jgi:hypothetical protein
MAVKADHLPMRVDDHVVIVLALSLHTVMPRIECIGFANLDSAAEFGMMRRLIRNEDLLGTHRSVHDHVHAAENGVSV